MKQDVVTEQRIDKLLVAFTPKGGCPLKHALEFAVEFAVAHLVAFTPKGGC